MQALPMIIAMAITTYATRIAGFSATRLTVPRQAEVFLRYVPIAAFAALIASGMQGDSSAGFESKILGAVVAAAVILRWQRFWAALMAGMIVFWIMGFLL